MALDHFIPQVHLNNFCSSELSGKRIYAFRKTDGKTFEPDSKSVCRLEEGNTNDYLTEPRAIEDFLTTIEPNYNRAVNTLRKKEVDRDAVYVISGFIAYVASCSPAAMRLSASPIRSSLENAARLLDAQGVFGQPPASLGASSITELLDNKKVVVKVDKKYPQAIGISQIMERQQRFGNFSWEILINDNGGSPFFTSDYPVALEATPSPTMTYKIVPLSPDIAVRIVPDLDYKASEGNFDFSNFRYAINNPNKKDVASINKLIIRCAESIVFSCHNQNWVGRFVMKNSQYRTETSTIFLPSGDRQLQISRQIIRHNSDY